MTKKAAIAIAGGLVAALLIASVALSTNFGLGSGATPALAKASPTHQRDAHPRSAHGPIVHTRHVTIHRERSGGTVTSGGGVVIAAPAGSTSTHAGSGTASFGGFEHEGGEGGGDD